MPDPLAWIPEESSAWRARGLERKLLPKGAAADGRIWSEDRWLVNFASNDYLSLAADPRVVEAASRAALTYGWGSGSSPLVSGWRSVHEELAVELAKLECVEASVLFPTGYAANLAAVTSLATKGDVIYSDELNHACLIDAARLSRAEVRIFPHSQTKALELTLEADRSRFRRSLIAVEGVYSMDGDVAPLEDLVGLAERFGAILLVDEAHATGLLGKDGAGASSGLGPKVHVRVGTLSKALGSIGGYVAGSRVLVDWLINHARTLVFSTAAPPAAAAAALRALEISLAEPWRRTRSLELAAKLRQELVRLGFDLKPSRSAIVPVVLGDPVRTLNAADELRSKGFLVGAIRPPTVPEGGSRLRVSLQAAHTHGDVDRLIDALREALAD